MNQQELKDRTKRFALRTIRLIDSLDHEMVSGVLGRQLLRAATSVGANYRAACRGRSKDEFVAKIGTVLEESDECEYWLELLVESGRVEHRMVRDLRSENAELTAIFASTLMTAKRHKSQDPK